MHTYTFICYINMASYLHIIHMYISFSRLKNSPLCMHIHTHVCVYTRLLMESLPFVTARVNLEGMMLAEISQRQKDKYCVTARTC